VKRQLLPLALIVMPNIPEAEVLSGGSIDSPEAARNAARTICELGPRWVVIKGGHLAGDPIDLVYDGETFTELHAERIDTRNTHGTGCTYSAAVAALLARGEAPLEAIGAAKVWLTEAIRKSYAVGDGHSPVNHFHGVHLASAVGERA